VNRLRTNSLSSDSMFSIEAVRECGVPLRVYDRDYKDCIIPEAEVRAGVGKPCGERDDVSLKKGESVLYRREPSIFAILDRLYNYC